MELGIGDGQLLEKVARNQKSTNTCYEAYDIVMNYAEKQSVDIRWFKEKRNCGNTFPKYDIMKLESFCTYCNKRFNHQDPVPCDHHDCSSIFCSRDCMNDHVMLLHISRT